MTTSITNTKKFEYSYDSNKEWYIIVVDEENIIFNKNQDNTLIFFYIVY